MFKTGDCMNKKIFLLFVMVFLFGGGFAFAEGTQHRFVIPKFGDFYCPPKGHYGTQISSDDVFDAAEDCNAWKSDFWSDTRPEAYTDCLKREKRFAMRYQLGICAPVYRKTHNVGKSGCLFEFVPKYNKVVRYSCFGPNPDDAIKSIKQKYEK